MIEWSKMSERLQLGVYCHVHVRILNLQDKI